MNIEPESILRATIEHRLQAGDTDEAIVEYLKSLESQSTTTVDLVKVIRSLYTAGQVQL